MKLIEKKCPNCGAKLEFSQNDKGCKCSFCKSSFEIERDITQDILQEQFNLKPFKIFSIFTVFSFFVIFIICVIVFIAIFSSIFNLVNNKNKTATQSTFDKKSSTKLIKDVKDLSNMDIIILDGKGKILIRSSGYGVNDLSHSYKLSGAAEKVNTFVLYQKKHNYIILIYKAIYYDFFHTDDQHSVYIPVMFENVIKDDLINSDIGKVSAPKYNFNAEGTCYVYGYSSYDEVYNDIIKNLENDYTISSFE